MHNMLNLGLVVSEFNPPVDALVGDINDMENLFRDGGFNRPTLAGTDARDGTNDTRPLSELGNAMRLEDAHGGNIHYVHDANTWLHWADGSWAWDNGAVLRSLAAELPAQIYTEGSSHLADAEHFANWSRSSQKERSIKAAVSLLQDFEKIRLPLSLIDADPLHIGIDNAQQVIDLKSGNVRRARRGDYITKSVNADHLGDSSQAIRWQLFLDQVFGDDPELKNWIKRWCGYLLTGSTNEQIFLFCYGLGANGKSVLGDILRHILGDYARAIASETITESKRQAGGATPDLADLIGSRLAISAETEDGAALAESLIKSLVAGDAISTRKLYCSPIQFTPRFKLMILGNHKPVIKGNDYGIWRRVRMIPFTRTFTADERDPYLLDKLKAEVPHILAWMVEGCIEWQDRGLADVPLTIKEATGQYQEDQDVIGSWLNECCAQSPNSMTPSITLYESYKLWADRNGLRPITSIALGRKLSERGFKSGKFNKTRSWEGLAVNQAGLLQDEFN